MTDDTPIRPVTDDELPAFAAAVALGFGETLQEDFIDVLRASTELDRTFAWFEDDRIVGTAETISFQMGLPGGGTAPCAGLTSVGVHPTRRRRGILNALLRQQMHQAHEREEPFGALYASESGIYGRYGYGPAAPTVSTSIDTVHSRLREPVTEVGPIELVDVEEALARLPAIYDRVLLARPGMMSRPPERWRAFVGYDPEGQRDGASARHHAVLGDRGYVIYRLKPEWSNGVPDGALQVVELLATDSQAELALWQLCLTMDLVARVEAYLRPPDDPLGLALVDPARLRVTASEPLWLRLLSLPDAVAARRYAGEGGAVVTIRDAFCPWNAGTWRLDLGPNGGACTATDAAPDLELDITDLAEAFLGGVRLSNLARARRVTEVRPGAAWSLDRLLVADPLPWNPRSF